MIKTNADKLNEVLDLIIKDTTASGETQELAIKCRENEMYLVALLTITTHLCRHHRDTMKNLLLSCYL